MATTKWLITVVAVDENGLGEAGFPPGQELTALPDMLSAVFDGLSPKRALALEGLFLLTAAQKEVLLETLEENSLPYHTYAVEERGERCSDKDCALHRAGVVIHLHDRRPGVEAVSETAPEGP